VAALFPQPLIRGYHTKPAVTRIVGVHPWELRALACPQLASILPSNGQITSQLLYAITLAAYDMMVQTSKVDNKAACFNTCTIYIRSRQKVSHIGFPGLTQKLFDQSP